MTRPEKAVGAEVAAATRQIDETDQARAQEYALLAALLSRSPNAQMIGHLVRPAAQRTQRSVPQPPASTRNRSSTNISISSSGSGVANFSHTPHTI